MRELYRHARMALGSQTPARTSPRAGSIVAGIELDATADACEPNASARPRASLRWVLFLSACRWPGLHRCSRGLPGGGDLNLLTSAVQAPAKLCSEAKVRRIRSFAMRRIARETASSSPSRPLCANSGHSSAQGRMGTSNPKLPFAPVAKWANLGRFEMGGVRARRLRTGHPQLLVAPHGLTIDLNCSFIQSITTRRRGDNGAPACE